MTDTTGMARVAGRQLLLVDDDPRVRSALTDLLTAGGYVVHTPESPSLAAVEHLLERLVPDVAVVDVHLPTRAVGLRVISTLCQRACVVVAISVNAGSRCAALQAGADSYVEKDGDPADLLAALTRTERARSHA